MVARLAKATHIMTVVAPYVKAVGALCGLTHMCLLQIFLTARHLASHALREVVSMAMIASVLVLLQTNSAATSALEILITTARATAVRPANRTLMEVMPVLMTAPL